MCFPQTVWHCGFLKVLLIALNAIAAWVWWCCINGPFSWQDSEILYDRIYVNKSLAIDQHLPPAKQKSLHSSWERVVGGVGWGGGAATERLATALQQIEFLLIDQLITYPSRLSQEAFFFFSYSFPSVPNGTFCISAVCVYQTDGWGNLKCMRNVQRVKNTAREIGITRLSVTFVPFTCIRTHRQSVFNMIILCHIVFKTRWIRKQKTYKKRHL